MRLQEIEKGDGFFRILLIKFISTVSGMRLPDAARIVMYHKDFYGKPMTEWTHAVMRGKSSWSVGERELFAAMTAKWNSCPFCIDAHGAIAGLVLDKTIVNATLEDFRKANLSSKLSAVLEFLEILAKTPDELTVEQVATVLKSGISAQELEDAMAIVTLFSITVSCANAFNFEMLDATDLFKAAERMLSQGYVFGKGKPKDRPDHIILSEDLRKRVLETSGLTSVELRQEIARRANGGPNLSDPVYDSIALQVGQSSYSVTDELVGKVVSKTGSEKAAFELITAAAVGRGLYIWQKGSGLLKQLKDKAH